MGTDNASTGLKLVVGLLITLVLLGIGIRAFQTAREGSNKAIADSAKDVSSLQDERYTQYDGVTITGAEVLATIQKFEADNIAVSVKTTPTTQAGLASLTTTSTGDTWYIKPSLTGEKYAANVEATQVRNAKNVTNAAYINPSGNFYGIVNRAQNTGAIQGISFFRVEG